MGMKQPSLAAIMAIWVLHKMGFLWVFRSEEDGGIAEWIQGEMKNCFFQFLGF